MDFVKNWTFCVCVTLIISVVFIIMSPKGSMGKFYKIIISIFIFISFLFPLTEFEFGDFRNNFNFESDYSDAIENSVDKEIEGMIENTLAKNNVKPAMVDVKTSIKNDEVTINKVNISIIDDYDIKSVENIVFEQLGIVADVKYIGE